MSVVCFDIWNMAHLNPFLADMDEDDAASFFTAELPPQFPPPPPPRPNYSHLKLPIFWADAPVAWFAAAEAQFQLRRITAEEERFCHVTAALDKSTLKKVVHLVVTPDPLHPYMVLKQALLASHEMTDFQRVEMLHSMEPLGGRKPSELLADMLELCPVHQQNNVFFVVLFLQRLPREIRILLTHEDHSDLRRLAAHADRLIAFSGRQTGDVAATVEEPEESTVAAIRGRGKPPQKQQRSRQQPPPIPPRPQSNQQSANNPPPSKLARESAGLCFYHWCHGEKAHQCKPPCSWQGI